MAVMAARNQLNIQSPVESDCACLNGLIHSLSEYAEHIILCVMLRGVDWQRLLQNSVQADVLAWNFLKEKIPVNTAVRGMCELLGFDPLYVANEGKCF